MCEGHTTFSMREGHKTFSMREGHAAAAQHFLNFFPDPQGHGSLRPAFGSDLIGRGPEMPSA